VTKAERDREQTEKYLNQIDKLSMLETEMNESDTEAPRNAYPLGPLPKPKKHCRSISKSSKPSIVSAVSPKLTELQFMVRESEENFPDEAVINTMISRAERLRYL
jgi:hypothetical protein